jgi:biotin carboxyl carrier protein
MKLNARVDGNDREVEIRLNGSEVIAEVDGRRYQLTYRRRGRSGMVLVAQSRVFDCEIEAKDSWGEQYEVRVGSDAYEVEIENPKRLRGSHAGASHGDGSAQITAPMPGKVVRILLEAGAKVEAGQGVVVVEAMKMQNELKSPRDGVVVSISATEGSTVNAGEVLAVIE